MFTFDSDIVSDLHKDAYGFRPSQSWWYGWTHATDAQKQSNWDSMVEAMVRSENYRKECEEKSVKEFESYVEKVIELGAKTRSVALRWIMDESTANGDWEYFCYLNGLPYQYFKDTK
jgi:hypothetical protein